MPGSANLSEPQSKAVNARAWSRDTPAVSCQAASGGQAGGGREDGGQPECISQHQREDNSRYTAPLRVVDSR